MPKQASEREAARRKLQRTSPKPSSRPAFLNKHTPTLATSDAVSPQSAGAQNVLLRPRPPPDKRYVTASQLRERYGGRSHMWITRRLKDDPTFPRPVNLGGSLLRLWDLDAIEAWERACATRKRA